MSTTAGSQTRTDGRAGLMLGLATLGFALNFWAWALLSPLAISFTAALHLSSFQQSLLVAVPVVVGSLGRIPVVESAAQTQTLLQAMMGWGVYLNLSLAMFNLLPIPPLDGSHVLKYVLPPGWAYGFQRMGFYGLIVIYVLLRGGLFAWWMAPARALFGGLLGFAGAHSTLFPSVLAPWGE